jgi:hypothetical protein
MARGSAGSLATQIEVTEALTPRVLVQLMAAVGVGVATAVVVDFGKWRSTA